MQDRFFEQFDFSYLNGATVILDVDGTLCPDGAEQLSQAAALAVGRLKNSALVYLASNKNNPERLKRFAEILGTEFLTGRKPSQKLLEQIPLNRRGGLTVIGDKFLTDGLFARRIGAEFVKVKRKTGANDGIVNRMVYFLDNACHFFAGDGTRFK